MTRREALTARNRDQLAALARVITEALATGGDPMEDERGVDILNHAYDVFEVDGLHDAKVDLLHELGMDADGEPLTDCCGYAVNSLNSRIASRAFDEGRAA
jgi:hypothetical protein